ncbi:MAG: DUF2807 domain-containing protein [Cyclobacteriaceae bacterium]|nr:DUF2807 domain-containing protein [Cyclobacteriaceae bacterium]
MKKLVYLVGALAFLVTFSVSAFQKEKRDVGSFNGVSIGVGGTVYIKIGNTTSVELEGDELDKIETEVEGKTLKIRREKSWGSWNSDDLTIYITTPELNAIKLSGSSKVIVESLVKAENMDISISGSGKIESKLNVESLDISISGSGKIELSGNANETEISISGSGKVEAEELATEIVKTRISGSGSIYITVNKEIDAKVSGSGDIYYKGNPGTVNIHSSGSGRIKKI